MRTVGRAGPSRRKAWRESRFARFIGWRFPNYGPHALRVSGRAAFALGKTRQAARYLERSIAAAEELGARYDLARALLDASRVIPEKADDYRRRGQQLLDELGRRRPRGGADSCVKCSSGVRELAPALEGDESAGKPPHSKSKGDILLFRRKSRMSPFPAGWNDRVLTHRQIACSAGMIKMRTAPRVQASKRHDGAWNAGRERGEVSHANVDDDNRHRHFHHSRRGSRDSVN